MIKNLRLQLFCVGCIYSALFAGHAHAQSSSSTDQSVYTISISVYEDGKWKREFTSTGFADGRVTPFKHGSVISYINSSAAITDRDGFTTYQKHHAKVFIGDIASLSLKPSSASAPQDLILDADLTFSKLIDLEEIHRDDQVIQAPHVVTIHRRFNLSVPLDQKIELGSFQPFGDPQMKVFVSVHREGDK